MSQHIIYCNDNADIILLDLPASIVHAQLSSQCLLSTPAPDKPYVAPEPKAAKRDALIAAIPVEKHEYHLEVQDTLRAALRVLHGQWHGPSWCRPRAHQEQGQSSPEHICLSHMDEFLTQVVSPPLVLSMTPNSMCCSSAIINTVVHNPYSMPAKLFVSAQEQYIIPPQSTFLRATIEQGSRVFESTVRCLLSGRPFDLILLDPPWSNRSVRNSRAYQSAERQLSDPFGQVLPLASTNLTKDGYVAVWITNKAAVRASVLEACVSEELVLVEEWIWLKVTSKGEPVTQIDGIWRHPYEVLLLFRRNAQVPKVVRRVSIAVPDIHSRKPSLKSIFEQLLPKNYTALEIFARSLTAGWWSWGDEVLKFQRSDNWR